MSPILSGISVEDLRPKVWVEDDKFLPVVSHDGDAGADIKLYLGSEKDRESTVGRCFRNIFKSSYGPFYIDGKPQDSEQVRERLEDSTPATYLLPGEGQVVSTGVFVQLPDLSKFGPWVPVIKVVSRSGLGAVRRVIVTQAPGIIDKPYTGEIKVSLTNLSADTHIFTHGARIAQLIYEVVVDQTKLDWGRCQVPQLGDFKETVRGSGGLGHTGV